MSKRSTPTGTSDNAIISGGEKGEVDRGGDTDVQLLLAMSGKFSVLVPDIFLNIMSRLPLKSLSQCRWVCKSWYKLIRSPCFAKIQFEWAIKNNSPWVFFWSDFRNLYLVDDQVIDLLETSATAHNLETDELERAYGFDKIFTLAGYVNGLICLASDPEWNRSSPFYIFNPITGEHITIPKSPKYDAYEISSFGFDPTTDEYKVIRFLQYKDDDGEYLSSEGEVYTLGSSEWRKIEDVPYIAYTVGCGVFLNGNLHWMSCVSDSLIIVAFNVGAEKFNVIQLPPMLQKDNIWERLWVMEEHLCFIHSTEAPSKPEEIWVMNDYGVQSSWVKKYNYNLNFREWFWFGSNYLIKLKNGEFLLQFEYSKEFIGYLDLEKDTLRLINVARHGEDHQAERYFQTVVQVGSLFSPNDAGISRGKKVEGRTQVGGETFLC